MAEGRLAPAPFSNEEHYVSAPLTGADFSYDADAIRDFLFDRASDRGKAIDFSAIYRVQKHLKSLVNEDYDSYSRSAVLGEYASRYRSALEISPNVLTPGERSVQVTSGLFLSNVAALAALRTFVIDRFWTPKMINDDRPKKLYLEKRKVYQEDIDSYYDYFNGDLPPDELDDSLMDIAHTARLLVSRKDWVGAITTTNNHEFVGSVLSERVVKQSLRNKFPETRYGTAEEDASPTKADVVVPLGQLALHLQVKMKMTASEFRILPDRTPMGVVVPMPNVRSRLTKPERNQLVKAVSEKAEELAA
jgi:hypothetical protein